MSESLSFVKVFPRDLTAHLSAVSAAARGVYISLALYLWDHGSLPPPGRPRQFATGCESPQALTDALSELEQAGLLDGDTLPLAETLRAKSLKLIQARRDASAKGNEARWGADEIANGSQTDPVAIPEGSTSHAVPNPSHSTSYQLEATSQELGAKNQELPVRKKSPPGGRALARTGGEHAQFIDWFCGAWAERRLGVAYAVQGGKDGAAVAWCLKQQGGAQEARRRAVRMLDSEDPWTAQHASLSLLRSRWNDFALEFRRKTKTDTLDDTFAEAARRLGVNHAS